jgi:hypothetical protein
MDLCTQMGGRHRLGMTAGFSSEWWPASNRNPGRLHVGIPGRIASESAASWSCGPVKPQETATWRAKENPLCWQPIATLCVLGPMGIATTLARRAQAKRRWLGEWDAWAAANIAPDRQATQQEAFGFYTSRKSARGLTVNSDRVIPWGSVQRWLWESGKLGLR